MTRYHAALPMYDLPEYRAQTDGFWADILAGLKDLGAEPLVDFFHPSTDAQTDKILRHPRLMLSQTCWGPISLGLTPELRILAQADFSEFVGGKGALYRSAIIATGRGPHRAPPSDDGADLPIDRLLGSNFAFNDRASLSGYLGITADMAAATGNRRAFYGHGEHSGGHRHSVELVANGGADIAAIDCKTWAMLQGVAPCADQVQVIGWTGLRKGLPYVCSPLIEAELADDVAQVLVNLGAIAVD